MSLFSHQVIRVKQFGRLASAWLLLAGTVGARAAFYTNLYTFSTAGTNDSGTNSTGYEVWGGLLLWSNALYGTTVNGGPNGQGTVFKLNCDGSGFTNLHDFTASAPDGSTGTYTNADGANPFSGLTLAGGALYGTTSQGGLGWGTVFRMNTDGTAFANLYAFSDSDGAGPQDPLLVVSDMLYGTTRGGGEVGLGTVFQLTTNGTDFQDLVNFSGSRGLSPQAGLILSGKLVYGTTEVGGTNGGGTVFVLRLPPPCLNIHLSGAQALLSWGNPAFSLEAASQVNGAFTNLPGATSPHTNKPDLQQQFFRLQ